jgi:glycosyltransferase involved in cell wall biosynthesis
VRVLLVSDYAVPHAGAEIEAVELRTRLRAAGHDARIFASDAQPLPLASPADYECRGTLSPLRRALQAANPLAARRLGSVLAEFWPDVVHLRMFLNQLSPLVLDPLRRVPTLLHVLNYDLICPVATKLLPDGSACHERAGPACRRAGCVSTLGLGRVLVQQRLLATRWDSIDLVAAMSEWVRDRLAADGIEVDTVLRSGVADLGPRPPLTVPPTIGYAGRLVPKKGVEVLLRAMRLVRDEVPDARLLVAGDGPERARLERLADGLGLRGTVTFFGHLSREDVERRLAPAWVQAVPSLWEEPFGAVAAEAMMRGSAVVVSATGGLTEQLREGETGAGVPPGDVEALALALLRLLGDRDLAERVGEAARRHALENLGQDATVERLLELYERLASTAKGSPYARSHLRAMRPRSRSAP